MDGSGEASRRLERAFEFDADELATNTRGELSPRQRDLADRHRARSNRSTAIAAALTIGVLAIVGPIALVVAGEDVPTAAVVAYGVLCLVVIGLFAGAVLVGRRRSRSLERGEIAIASGVASSKVRRTKGDYGRAELYLLKIGSKRLKLANQRQLGAFDNGTNYVVYYLDAPGTPIVLSARTA